MPGGVGAGGGLGGGGRAAAWLCCGSPGSPGLHALHLSADFSGVCSGSWSADLGERLSLPLPPCCSAPSPPPPPTPEAEGSCSEMARPGGQGLGLSVLMDQKSPKWPVLLPGESLGWPHGGGGGRGGPGTVPRLTGQRQRWESRC